MTGHSVQPVLGVNGLMIAVRSTIYEVRTQLTAVGIPRSSIRHGEDESECRYRAMQQRRTKDDGHQSLSLSSAMS